MNSNTTRGPRKKIVRVSDEYDLDGIGREMAKLWTHPNSDERFTLEMLRDYFNERVLEAAIDQQNVDVMPGFVDGAYESLFHNDDPIEEEEVRLVFENNGVDIDSITDDFISSPQTIHNYLLDVENVELYPEEGLEERKKKSLNHLSSLDKRYENIVSDIIDRLVKEGDLDDVDYEITVDCFVENKETNRELHIKDILQS